jgi:hypothetical protein
MDNVQKTAFTREVNTGTNCENKKLSLSGLRSSLNGEILFNMAYAVWNEIEGK